VPFVIHPAADTVNLPVVVLISKVAVGGVYVVGKTTLLLIQPSVTTPPSNVMLPVSEFTLRLTSVILPSLIEYVASEAK
jgi:hypothetical protein